MHSSLVCYLRQLGIQKDALSATLPILINALQEQFCKFADCGAGVGIKSAQFSDMLKNGLTEANWKYAELHLYEPLAQNYSVLSQKMAGEPMARLRPVAVSDYMGAADFMVPWRSTGSSKTWTKGTSFVGFLGKRPNMESVPVEVVRLDEEVSRLDFVKLDLQGGEVCAIKGLGELLETVKVIHTEHQFLSSQDSQSLNYLTALNFICYYDSVQIGFKEDLQHIPLPLLEEAGIVIERAIVHKEAKMGLTLYGYLNSTNTRHLRYDGNYTFEFVDVLRKSGIRYFQTDILAVNCKYYGAWQSILSSYFAQQVRNSTQK